MPSKRHVTSIPELILIGEPAQSSAFYGIAGTVEGNRMVNDLLCGVFDYMYDI